MGRRFPAPWTVEKIPGGYKVLDANGQTLAYVYADDRQIVKSLTEDEARRIASNITKLPALLTRVINSAGDSGHVLDEPSEDQKKHSR